MDRVDHFRTGEPIHRHVDWQPRLPRKEAHGRTGEPVRALFVCEDRVEIQTAWCFSSGHMELYEEEPLEVVRRDDPTLAAVLVDRFDAAVAEEVARIYADTAAFRR